MTSNSGVRDNRDNQKKNSLKRHDPFAMKKSIPDRTNKKRGFFRLFGITVVIIAVVFCVFCGIFYNHMVRSLRDAQDKLTQYQTRYGDSNASQEASADTSSSAGTVQAADSEESESAGVRRVYLTFDDGPSTMTDRILDVLDRYGVKATFFVVGRTDTEYQRIYRRIVQDGHTLGMHSYSHNYSQIYDSLDSFQADMHKLQDFLYEQTGVWTTYYRFPGGSSNTVGKAKMQDLIDYLGRENVTYFDWNIYGGDDVDAATMVKNVTENLSAYSDAMILMHDASDKEATVQALPEIIEYIQKMDNTVIVPVTEDTIPVQHHKSTNTK